MLVDLPNWVGDQMITMPAVHRLVEGNRGGTTALHTRPNMLRFLSAVFPDAGVAESPQKASPFSSARRLRQNGGRFEVGVTLRNSARAKILIRLVAFWCGGSRGEGARVLLSAACEVDRSRHQIYDADPILAVLGIENIGSSWHPSLPVELKDEGDSTITAAGVDRYSAIGLAPATARGAAKRWPGRRYGELARRLRAEGYEPVVVIGPGEDGIAEEVFEAARLELPIIGGDTDVAGLAALIANLRVLVANDSGPMQLATCLGIPVVAVFGATDPKRTAPVGSGNRTVSPPPGLGAGTRNVSVDQVEAAALDLLAEIGLDPRDRLVR
jgi:ADP-heptose:LPS heptosyltransferase